MTNNMQKIHSLLGIAMRAGKLVSGEDGTIVAEDASNNTKKLFKDKSSFRHVNCIELSTKSDLGISIGKDSRAVIGIKDIGFANKIIRLID